MHTPKQVVHLSDLEVEDHDLLIEKGSNIIKIILILRFINEKSSIQDSLLYKYAIAKYYVAGALLGSGLGCIKATRSIPAV